MTWIAISILAYFLTALSSILDKVLLRKGIPNPLAYTFYVGVFGFFVILFAPFGFSFPAVSLALFSLVTGFLFIAALWAFFVALHESSVSDVVTLLGATTPIFILTMTSALYGTSLSVSDFTALLLLIVGGMLISATYTDGEPWYRFYHFRCFESVLTVIFSSFLFALFFIFSKYVFNHIDFLSGFILTRSGSLLFVLLLLLIPSLRKSIFSSSKKVSKKTGVVFISNKIIGGVASVLISYAVAIGNPLFVNALEGIKYVFVLALVYIISRFNPMILQEQFSRVVIIRKLISIILIFIGLVVLVTNPV